MVINDDARGLTPRRALWLFASRLAPTKAARYAPTSPSLRASDAPPNWHSRKILLHSAKVLEMVL